MALTVSIRAIALRIPARAFRVKSGVESRTGAVALASRWLLTKLSRRRLSPVWLGPVSCSRSSNRTGRFPASGSRKRHTMVRVTPSATSEHNSGWLDSSSIPMSFVASCVRLQLRPLPSTGVTRLHRYYEPLRHPTRPDLSLASCRLILINYDHRWGFPCCYWSTLHACRRHYPGRSDETRSLVLSHQRRPSRLHGGLAPALIVSRPAQRSLHVTACMLAKSPK